MPQGEKETLRGIEKLLTMPVYGQIDKFEDMLDPDDTYMTLALGNGNSINVHITTEDCLVAHVQDFRVKESLRRRGIGERLLKACISQMKTMGVRELWSRSTSPSALALRAKVLGEDNLRFYDYDTLNDTGFWDINYAHAQVINAYIDETLSAQRAYERQLYIGVFVDLDGIDTRGWPLPDSIEVREHHADFSLR